MKSSQIGPPHIPVLHHGYRAKTSGMHASVLIHARFQGKAVLHVARLRSRGRQDTARAGLAPKLQLETAR